MNYEKSKALIEEINLNITQEEKLKLCGLIIDVHYDAELKTIEKAFSTKNKPDDLAWLTDPNFKPNVTHHTNKEV